MRFDTLIRGGTIVTASDTHVGDVGIVGGKISVIGLNLPAEGAGKVKLQLAWERHIASMILTVK